MRIRFYMQLPNLKDASALYDAIEVFSGLEGMRVKLGQFLLVSLEPARDGAVPYLFQPDTYRGELRLDPKVPVEVGPELYFRYMNLTTGVRSSWGEPVPLERS